MRVERTRRRSISQERPLFGFARAHTEPYHIRRRRRYRAEGAGILFSTGKSNLSKASQDALSDFATSLLENPLTDVTINGHTDNTGSRAVNERLSKERAQAVANFLIGKGVPSKRLTINGLAYDCPVASNETAEGRAQNRRVEIYIAANEQMVREAENGTLK